MIRSESVSKLDHDHHYYTGFSTKNVVYIDYIMMLFKERLHKFPIVKKVIFRIYDRDEPNMSHK